MYGALTKAVKNFEIEETGETIKLPVYNKSTGEEGIVWDTPVYLYLTIDAAAKLADRGEPFEYYDENDMRQSSEIEVDEPHYGFSGWSDDGFNEALDEEFGSPVTPADKSKKQEELEAEAKVRPDLVANRDWNDPKKPITGWKHNPNYKGPKLGPGGVEVDDEGKPIKKKKKPTTRKKTPAAKKKQKRRASMVAAELKKVSSDELDSDPWYWNKKKNELLDKLKTLPYAADIKVFGSAARGKEMPGDFDIFIDLRGKGKHDAWMELLKLAQEYYGMLDPFIIADAGIVDGKPTFNLWARNDRANGWIPSRNRAKMMENMEKEGVSLTSIQTLKTAAIDKQKPKIQAHQSDTTMYLDWMWIPQEMRGKGIGSAMYKAWEDKLPKEVTVVRLQAATAGDRPAAPFWDNMGFSFVYNYETGDYEADNQMWKGVNGHPTPKSLHPDDEDPDPNFVVEAAQKENYVYHVTPRKNLKAIRQEGLKQEKGYALFDDTPKATHFTEAPGLDFWTKEVTDYYEGPVAILKVPRTKLRLLPDEFGTDDSGAKAYRVEHDVPPSDISFVKFAAKPVNSVGPVYFRIQVPQASRAHFWDEPPEGHLEFWAFKDRPRCFINQKIIFSFGKQPVAEASVLRVEDPGLSKCTQTGKFKRHWKVMWHPSTFKKYTSFDERKMSANEQEPGEVEVGDMPTTLNVTPDRPEIIETWKHLPMAKRDAMVHSAKEIEVDPNELKTNQKTLKKKDLARFMDDPDNISKPWGGLSGEHQKHPLVLDTDEGMYIYDGNHRCAAAQQLGQKIKVLYIDLRPMDTDKQQILAASYAGEDANREWAESQGIPIDLFGRARMYHAIESGREKDGLFGTLHATPQAALKQVEKAYCYSTPQSAGGRKMPKLIVMEAWVPLNLFRLVAMTDGGFIGFTRGRIPAKDLKVIKEKDINKTAAIDPVQNTKWNKQWAKERGLQTDLFDRVKLYIPALPSDVTEGLVGGDAGINEGEYVYDSIAHALIQMRRWYVKREKVVMFEVWVPFDSFRLDMYGSTQGSMAQMMKPFTSQEADMMPVKFKEHKKGSLLAKDFTQIKIERPEGYVRGELRSGQSLTNELKIEIPYRTVAFLDFVIVNKNARNQGTGKELVEDFLHEAKKQGAEACILEPIPSDNSTGKYGLEKFYASLGFTMIPWDKEKHDKPPLVMVKPLLSKIAEAANA